MELWIRTQGGTALVKVTNVAIYNNDIITYGNEYKSNGYFTLGYYYNEKRALEVLQEIQDILVDYKQMSRVVYKMPLQ